MNISVENQLIMIKDGSGLEDSLIDLENRPKSQPEDSR
jgi:hypothetical protein